MEVLAYGYERSRDDLRPLGASPRKVYIDTPADRRAHRAELLRDVRPGDVVRVLYRTDLGGPRWQQWRDKIEAKGATVEEHRPVKIARRGGRPKRHPDSEALRTAWLDDAASLDARIAACGAVLGVTLGRADRHWLYGRYGSPDNPKPRKEE